MNLESLNELASRLIAVCHRADEAGRSIADALTDVDVGELGIDAAAAFWIGEGARGTDIPPDPAYVDHYNLGRELARRFARPIGGTA